MATKTDLTSILQTVDQILADHQPSYKSVLNSIDQILDQYASDGSQDGDEQYDEILLDIDNILAQYSKNDNNYDKIVTDIDSLISQYGDDQDQIENRETNNVEIPMNTDVSTLKKVTRLTDEQAANPDEPVEDPDKQGLIRQVPKAHLVYKRRMDNDTFEELWIYNVTQLTNDTKIRQAILAGTEISLASSQSPDGAKKCVVWSMGNAECIKLTGIPE